MLSATKTPMYTCSNKDSLPTPAGCFKAGVFVNHFANNLVEVALKDGTLVKTCHIIANGTRFTPADVFEKVAPWNYIWIRQFSYLDLEGNVKVIDVNPKRPHYIDRNMPTTQVAHATKINGQRWGVTIKVNLMKNDFQIVGDQDSPIIGCLFQLIE